MKRVYPEDTQRSDGNSVTLKYLFKSFVYGIGFSEYMGCIFFKGMYPGRKWADGARLREVCEDHEKKLAEIQTHTTELEQQRKGESVSLFIHITATRLKERVRNFRATVI